MSRACLTTICLNRSSMGKCAREGVLRGGRRKATRTYSEALLITVVFPERAKTHLRRTALPVGDKFALVLLPMRQPEQKIKRNRVLDTKAVDLM